MILYSQPMGFRHQSCKMHCVYCISARLAYTENLRCLGEKEESKEYLAMNCNTMSRKRRQYEPDLRMFIRKNEG